MSMNVFDLSQTAEFDETNVKTRILASSGEARQALLSFRAGQSLPGHRARGPITVLGISGRLVFDAGGRSETIAPGTLVQLEGQIEHSVRAETDAVMLLTLLPPA